MTLTDYPHPLIPNPNTLTTLYSEAIKDYGELESMFKACVNELETNYPYPAFKQTDFMQVTLVFDGTKVAGFSLWFYDPINEIMFIGLIYTAPEYRNKGFASIIMSEIRTIAGALKAKYINSYVINDNASSMKLHKKFFGGAVGAIFTHIMPQGPPQIILP